ncbi:MAG: hypothetical protein NXI31_20650 [bacterium]|nr:hypothetical protein [bacterium]
MTVDKALLGKVLFWDEQLSSTGSIACGTCHILAHGGGDPRALTTVNPGPDGVYGTADDGHASPGVPPNSGSGAYGWSVANGSGPQPTRRMAPTMINAAYLDQLFWDGRAEDATFVDPLTNQTVLTANAQLENLVAQPPTDEVEMAHPGRTWSDVVARVQSVEPLAVASNLPGPMATFIAGKTYPQLYQQAFGTPGVDASRTIMAIASYLRTLVSDQSPVDNLIAGTGTLPAAAMAGKTLFDVFCSRCHSNFNQLVLTTGPRAIEFRNTGVRPLGEDAGRGDITGLATDDGKFKVPDLRNVALRGPYFHNGNHATLADVLQFYNRGGDFHVNQDPVMPALVNRFSATDQANLVAFLNEMTDPRVQAELPPFDRPTLFSESLGNNLVYGTGTPGTGGVTPRAIAVEPPHLGGLPVTVTVDRTEPTGLALIGWDLAPAPTPTVIAGLNVHLALTTAANLTVAGTLQGTGGSGSGHASWTFALPAQPAFAGLDLYGQWLVTDPGGPNGFTTSAGFRLTTF